MAEEQQVTSQQIDNALQVVSDACSRAEPPPGTSMSNWQWTDATRNALNILAAVARSALKQADTELAPELPTTEPALEPVSVNGDQ